MKKGVMFGLMTGIALIIALFVYSGFGKIVSAIATAGWTAVILMALSRMLPLFPCAFSWRLVSPLEARPGLAAFLRARWVRDAMGELWVTPPLGNELAGMRVLMLAGMKAPMAAASTLVDLTEELASQIAYTLIGVLLVASGQSGESFTLPALTGLLAAAVATGGFVYAQNAGLLLRLEEVVSKWSSEWLKPVRLSIAGIHGITNGIYRRKASVFWAFLAHLFAWFCGALAAWVGLRFIGHPLSWHQVIALEAITFALRSAIFVAPAGLGVQEAGYVLAGHLFGLDAASALALSILLRAAEWLRALPALLMWQVYEGNRWWRLRNGR
jgi:putative membrane protein